MTSQKETISIYAYDNFRLYLKDRYTSLQQADPTCSARSFARKAGFSNPGYMNDVMKGKRTLSQASREKVAKVFDLSESEADYFNILVEYGQAKKEPLRTDLYKKMLFRRNKSSFAKLNPALSKYYQDFRYPLIYNAIMACDFRGDFDRLSEFIYPSIPVSQLKNIVKDLCMWGLVISQGEKYTVTQRFIEPPSTLMEHVRQLNIIWIQQAAEALMKLPANNRHMSTMLLSTTPAVCKKISDKIEQFRQDIWKLVDEEKEDPSCIMQLNMQYFPRSRHKKHE